MMNLQDIKEGAKYYWYLTLAGCLSAIFIPIMAVAGEWPECKCGCKLSKKQISKRKQEMELQPNENWARVWVGRSMRPHHNINEIQAFFTNHHPELKDDLNKYMLLM